MNGKRLYRSESNRMLCGVCAGIAEYFQLDPTLIRLAWVLCCCFGIFPAVIAYIAAAVIIPSENAVQ
nr:PspC domain-containing protein [uncultured Agathobaculum sp.]